MFWCRCVAEAEEMFFFNHKIDYHSHPIEPENSPFRTKQPMAFSDWGSREAGENGNRSLDCVTCSIGFYQISPKLLPAQQKARERSAPSFSNSQRCRSASAISASTIFCQRLCLPYRGRLDDIYSTQTYVISRSDASYFKNKHTTPQSPLDIDHDP